MSPCACWASQCCRLGGFTLMECLAALALVAGFTVMAVPLIGQVQEIRLEQSRRQVALTELRNISETGLSQPDARLELRPEIRSQLPGAELTVARRPENSDPPGEQVTLSLHWTENTGRVCKPVTLRFWTFPAPAGTASSPNGLQE